MEGTFRVRIICQKPGTVIESAYDVSVVMANDFDAWVALNRIVARHCNQCTVVKVFCVVDTQTQLSELSLTGPGLGTRERLYFHPAQELVQMIQNGNDLHVRIVAV
jgi:hypothetical protein